jgi:predicted RNA-binding protein YlqC (UPF0109 family)
MNTLKETLQYILTAITPAEDKVTVESSVENEIEILEIIAPKEIIGKIIGKEGKIIKSIRTILSLSFPQSRFVVKIKD